VLGDGVEESNREKLQGHAAFLRSISVMAVMTPASSSCVGGGSHFSRMAPRNQSHCTKGKDAYPTVPIRGTTLLLLSAPGKVLAHILLERLKPAFLAHRRPQRRAALHLVVDSHRRLHSASTAEALVPATRRSMIGDRALAVDGPYACNSIPVDLRLSRTFSTFKTHLKSHLFNVSFPSV